MGAAQSSIPTEAAVLGAIVAGGITAYGVYSRNGNVPTPASSEAAEAKARGGKKGKGKKKAGSGADSDAEFERAIAAANKENAAAAAAAARVVRAPEVVPGTFEFNPTSNSESEGAGKKARKKKGKKATSGSTATNDSKNAAASSVVETKEEPPARPEQVIAPQIVQADPPPASASSSKKSKKRKGKSGTPTPAASGPLAASIDMSDAGDDASWTRVSTRKKIGTSTNPNAPESAAGASSTDAELLTSDTNLTSGATDPDMTETEEEPDDAGTRKSGTVSRKTFAERMLPKRKTGVEEYVVSILLVSPTLLTSILNSMEDEPLQPTLARVMAIRPSTGEKPAKGFSWGDYEEYAGADEGGTSGADVSNDDAWEQVTSKKKARPIPASSFTMASSTDSLSNSYSALQTQDASAPKSKKARQNAEKREAQRTEKEAAERERVERLAKHKKELEKIRMAEQFASGGKKGNVSGGMQATVGEGGKLVWE